MKKIIQISCWPQLLSEDVFRKVMFHDWHVRTGENVLKSTKKYSIECWNPDRGIKKTETTKKNGIVFKRFPYVGINPNIGFKGTSFEMLDEIEKETRKNEVLIHFHGYSSYVGYHTFIKFGKKIPIVGQHHGSTPPIELIKRKPWTIIAFPLLILEELFERISYQKVSRFLVLSEKEKNNLRRYLPYEKIEILSMGADFDDFKPINKLKARKALKLPANKKIVLFCGRYGRGKGADKVIQAMKNLKKEDKNVMLIMLGGDDQDEFYHQARKESDLEVGKVKHSVLKQYLSAADVSVMYCNDTVRRYGGMGVTMMESLACGTPIVSTNLLEIPPKERRLVGMMPENEKELESQLGYVINNQKQFIKCREIGKKYYDWKNISKRHVKIYDELFEKFKKR